MRCAMSHCNSIIVSQLINKKMNLGIIITGLVCVALFAIPFILPMISRKKKEKQLLAGINDLAKQQDCIIRQYEVCGN